MFLKVNLGVVKALKNVERTYLLENNDKSGKGAELELYSNSLEHYYLVISGLLWFGCS